MIPGRHDDPTIRPWVADTSSAGILLSGCTDPGADAHSRSPASRERTSIQATRPGRNWAVFRMAGPGEELGIAAGRLSGSRRVSIAWPLLGGERPGSFREGSRSKWLLYRVAKGGDSICHSPLMPFAVVDEV